jgi:hypothetical protein
MLIKTKGFEFEVSRGGVYVRLGRWDRYFERVR